jgi:uncharacterized protein YcbK (DUF882 family)
MPAALHVNSFPDAYKRDGRYIPSAMAQLDYFLRDWRTNGFVSMSGETIDLDVGAA